MTYHTPHSRSHGNCILNLLAWCASHRSGCWNPKNSRSVRLWIQRDKLRRLYYEEVILPLLLHEVITRYLLWIRRVPHCRPLEVEGTAVLTEICFCAVVVAMDAEGNVIQPKSIDTTFAAIELSRVQTFWVKCQVIMIWYCWHPHELLHSCQHLRASRMSSRWPRFMIPTYLTTPSWPCTGHRPGCLHRRRLSRSRVTLSLPIISLVLSSITKQISVWVSDEMALMVFKPLEAWQNLSASPTGSPGRSVAPGKSSSPRTRHSVVCPWLAGSPEGDGPAGQDSWLPVGPIRTAGGPIWAESLII